MSEWNKTEWIFEDGTVITIHEVLALSRDIPVEILPTEEIEKIRTVDTLDETRVTAADLAYPLLIVEDEDRRWILDGNHRLQKAINEGHATIRAKILKDMI